jgi:hypothetical protein
MQIKEKSKTHGKNLHKILQRNTKTIIYTSTSHDRKRKPHMTPLMNKQQKSFHMDFWPVTVSQNLITYFACLIVILYPIP